MLSFSGKVVIRRVRGWVATRWCSPSERGMQVEPEKHRRKKVRLCFWLWSDCLGFLSKWRATQKEE